MKENLTENSARIGKYLLENIIQMNPNARGKGLMIAMDVKDGRKTVLDLIDERILTIYSKNTVRILPPLIIEKKHADHFISVLEKLEP